MGTLFRIVVYAPEVTAAKSAAKAGFARIAALNRIMSDYDPDSELMRLCRQPAGTPVPVSKELCDILQRSQELAEKSGGAFDVTLGPVIRLWREARRQKKLPSEESRNAALLASGYRKLRLDLEGQTVTLLAAGMQLDLGGIAKGYAADAALTVLARHGFRRAMVEASGDIALGEPPPESDGWKVQLAPFGSAISRTRRGALFPPGRPGDRTRSDEAGRSHRGGPSCNPDRRSGHRLQRIVPGGRETDDRETQRTGSHPRANPQS